MAISSDERAFFVELGARIAGLRKAKGITQVLIAEKLDVSQQTINFYEVGRRRVPVSTLPILARVLEISIDELLGEQPKLATRKRGPMSRLQQQVEQVSQLPRNKQKLISEMLDGVINQKRSV